ncbi:MAG: hypothetical protein IJ740_08590, partial [Ruminococcus sp.]|nr:hypothetical protein [Ruminococcus sp.]
MDPITKKEFYLSILGGGEYPFPTPITREEKYLAKLAGLDVDVPNTITRKEKIMGTLLNNSKIDFPLITRLDLFMAATNDETIVVPEPVTREEQFWAKIALSYVVTATYDGPLPVALYTVSGSAEYKIYGAATGVGERTAQLIGPDALDPDNGFEEGVLLRYDGRTAQSASFNTYGYIAVEPETTYYRRQSHNQSSVAGIWFYDSEKNY